MNIIKEETQLEDTMEICFCGPHIYALVYCHCMDQVHDEYLSSLSTLANIGFLRIHPCSIVPVFPLVLALSHTAITGSTNPVPLSAMVPTHAKRVRLIIEITSFCYDKIELGDWLIRVICDTACLVWCSSTAANYALNKNLHRKTWYPGFWQLGTCISMLNMTQLAMEYKLFVKWYYENLIGVMENLVYLRQIWKII